MSAPGRFRNDMIAAANAGREALPPKAVVATAPADPYVNWLDRMQRTRGRHAAITRNLYTWSNYKNWAAQAKDGWQDPTNGNGGKK